MSFLKKIQKRENKRSSNKCFNLKKFSWMEEKELGSYLTPLEQFEGGEALPEGAIEFNVYDKMKEYIEKNITAYPIAPMPGEWINDPNLNSYFQMFVKQMFPAGAEQFISQAIQSTYMSQEGEAASSPQTWQDVLGSEVDLVDAFLTSPNSASALKQIAYNVMNSRGREGIGLNDAQYIATKAVPFALGVPIVKERGTSSRKDQRYNYFLFNPDKMPSNVAQEYNQFRVTNPDAEKNELIDYLKNTHAQELMDVLLAGIQANDESIITWISKQQGHVKRDKLLGTSLTGGEGRGTNIQDTDIARLEEERVMQKGLGKEVMPERKNILQKQATELFAKYYLGGIAEDMKDILSQAVEIGYSQYEGKPAYLLERMNIFNTMLIDQYNKLLSSEGQINPKTGNMIFQNEDGKVEVPSKTVEDVFKGNINRTPEELYKEILDLRQKGTPKFDVLDWFQNQGKSILTHRALQSGYQRAYALHTAIRNAYSQGWDAVSIANVPAKLQSFDFTGMKNEEFQKTLGILSNTQENLPPEEKKRRRLRYIERAIDPASEHIYNKYKTYSEINFGDKARGIPADPKAKKSMKPFAQYDSRYLMEGLNSVKQQGYEDETGKKENYPSDIFKAFMGSLNPHKKVREDYYPDIYNNLIGKNDKEFQEDTSMLNESQKVEFLQLEKLKNHYENSLQKKQDVLEGKRNEAKELVKTQHNRIKKAYEKHLELLKKNNMPFMELGEFAGVPGWDGESVLTKEDYIGMIQNKGFKIGKIIDKLWGHPDKDYSYKMQPPMKKIDTLENPTVQMAFREGEPVLDTLGNQKEADIRQQGIPYIQKKLDEIEVDLDKFRKIHNMSQTQYEMVSALCKDYFVKMASIERIQNNYSKNKIASVVVDLDILTIAIERKFNSDFDKIFSI